MTGPRYATPAAFKQALEHHLRSATGSGADLVRRRQLLVFERFLARIHLATDGSVVLKGGLVLEVRLRRARSTKDVDLRMMGSPAQLLERLQRAGTLDLDDFMRFEVQRDRHHPDILGDGMKYAGHRFTAECRLAGKIYGRRFGIDIGFGDPLVGEPDEVSGDRLLDFAGITPTRIRVYPVASHIAEKLHAYTMPRTRPNSRVKDLPDLALLATTGPIAAEELRRALKTTFSFRETHPIPTTVTAPPEAWREAYRTMADADDLPWPTLEAVHGAAARFLNPVLSGATAVGVWNPERGSWDGS